MIEAINQNFNHFIAANPMDRFSGHYEVTYWKAWFIPIYIDVDIWTGNGCMYAKVFGDTYELLPIAGRDKEFTVKEKPGSVVRFNMDGDRVKNVYLDLPSYGSMEGKPK